MRRMRTAVKHQGFGEIIDRRGTRAARRLRVAPARGVSEISCS
jgi:hypothetical protein